MRKTIVISAVNIVEAGTLAILKDCLQFLSNIAIEKDLRVVAVVYQKSLVPFPNIEYIETEWPKKRWVNRLWFEYKTSEKISKEIGPVHLWFSLHDTTPTVHAVRRAVYCHNSFSFYKWSINDLLFAPKILMFALFTKFIYKKNIHKNDFLVVQQNWMKEGLRQMFNLNTEKIIVFPSRITSEQLLPKEASSTALVRFLYPASPNSHKNFEVIGQAAELLEKRGVNNFEVVLTVQGNENKYAAWLFKKFGSLKTVNFKGFLKKEGLNELYLTSNCLIFPSKVESWGLPISEFSGLQRPMILADLPYAHETAAGSELTTFFNPTDFEQLADLMKDVIQNKLSAFKNQPIKKIEPPVAHNWSELFEILI